MVLCGLRRRMRSALLGRNMRIVSVVGARPQFVKLAPIADALAGRDVNHVVVDTGQHYDAIMSTGLVESFGLPRPDYSLGIGSGTHGKQTAAMLSAIEDVLVTEHPDWVLVYGDTNSTIAAALAAVKLDQRLCHLEAGLRSYNRSMPEEHNRILVDHASDLLLAPTELAVRNLCREGLGPRSRIVGDVMADICLRVAERMAAGTEALPPVPAGGYVLATLHRPYNTDDPQRLAIVIDALASMPLPVILPAHPRLVAKARDAGIELSMGSIQPTEPLVYSELILTAMNAAAVVTDSGGLQKEAYLLGVPCTTIRSETEWVETVDSGWNQLVFTPEDLVGLPSVVLRDAPSGERPAFYGNGHAAEEAVAALLDFDVR